MLRIFFKATVNRVTRVADRDFTDERIDQKVHRRADKESKYRVDRLTAGEEVQADQTSEDYDRDAQIPIEILLRVERVVPACDTVADEVPFLKRAVHSKGNLPATTAASDTIAYT